MKNVDHVQENERKDYKLSVNWSIFLRILKRPLTFINRREICFFETFKP